MFKEISESNSYSNTKRAHIEFSNGYGISVIIGDRYFSNGIDTYEACVTYFGDVSYCNGVADGLITFATKEQITEIMQKLEKL